MSDDLAEKPPVKLTIHSTCNVTPQLKVVLGGSNPDRGIQWRTNEKESAFIVTLPGGYFQGHPDNFQLIIHGDQFRPTQELTLIYPITSRKTISNYITDDLGNRCRDDRTPPEIVIEAP